MIFCENSNKRWDRGQLGHSNLEPQQQRRGHTLGGGTRLAERGV
jgi:hypothetical protein